MDELTKWEPSQTAVPLQQDSAPVSHPLHRHRSEGEFDRYFRIIARRKWLIIAATLTVFAGVSFRTFTTIPLYRSTAKIQIDPEDKVLPYQPIQELSLISNDYIQTQAEVLRSRRLIERVVLALGLETPEKASKRADSLRGNLEVLPRPGTRIVNLNFVGPDPEFAARFANAVAAEFVNYDLESKYEATSRARDFLDLELRELKEKIRNSEREIVQYALKHKDIMVLDSQDNYLLKKINDLQTEVSKIDKELLANEYEAIKEADPETLPVSAKTATITALEEHLLTLEQKLSSLSVQYGPVWPEVKK